jgi:mono/diheme cytochrome c family protein
MMKRIIESAAAGAALACAVTFIAQAAEPRSAKDGAYTAAQAKRGAAIYAVKCETCHGPQLTAGEAPPLIGEGFMANWSAYSVGDLFEKIRNTMPANDAKSLSAREYADIVALILSANRFPPGDAELPDTAERLKQIRFETAK